MPRFLPILASLLPALAGLAGGAQVRVIGSVPISEAATTGALAVSGTKNLLGGDSVITALDRPAHVSLFRGGELLVCQSSITHLTGGQHMEQFAHNMDPLLVSLDRGALELHMPFTRDDALITPDFRFISIDTRDKAAPLNLAIRVTPNGDTCVDNRGRKAPTLALTDPFSQASYLLKPGQHVLFEHGSLKEVVDSESSSCGCPPAQSLSLADAAIRGLPKKKGRSQPDPTTFPAAVSEGLTPASPVPAEKPGSTHVQVNGTLTFDPSAPSVTDTPAAATPAVADGPATAPPEVAPAPTPVSASAPRPADPPPAQRGGALHSIGHFFRRIFAR